MKSSFLGAVIYCLSQNKKGAGVANLTMLLLQMVGNICCSRQYLIIIIIIISIIIIIISIVISFNYYQGSFWFSIMFGMSGWKSEL